MFYVFNFVVSILGSLASWFLQKVTTKGLAFVALKGFQVAANVLFLAMVYFGTSFITNIYSILTNVISSMNNYNQTVVIGENNIPSLIFAFMDASGVGIAFHTVMDLFITVVLFKLSWFLYKIYSVYAFTSYTFFADIIKTTFSK